MICHIESSEIFFINPIQKQTTLFDNVEKEIPTVYCNDLKGRIRRVCVLRNESDEDIYSKIGIDSGKGMDM